MPNLPNRGMFGRVDAGPGAGAPMVDGVASLVGSTVPRPILQMFATGPSGTPVLVWSRSPAPVTGVSRTFVDPTAVTVAWTLTANVEADTWDVRRPDGSLIGTITWDGILALVQTLQDTSPKPNAWTVDTAIAAKRGGASSGVPNPRPAASGMGAVTAGSPLFHPSGTAVYTDGSVFDSLGWQDGAPAAVVDPATYTVTAKLGGIAAAAGSAPLLNLALPVRNLATNIISNPGSVIVLWLYPTYGLPDGYELWRNGTLIVTNPNTLMSFTDANPNRGVVNEYTVVPLLSGARGQPSNIQQPMAAATPLQGTLTWQPIPFISLRSVNFTWLDGPGFHSGYEWFFIVDGIEQAHTVTGNTHSAVITANTGQTVYGRVRALSDAGNSPYSGLGPLVIG